MGRLFLDRYLLSGQPEVQGYALVDGTGLTDNYSFTLQ